MTRVDVAGTAESAAVATPRRAAEPRQAVRVRRRRHTAGESHKRRDIQGLRAVAVASVVLYHAGWSVLFGGFVGVDVFFVISGFLITGNIVRGLGDGRFTLLGFYANRARRLLPAAFLTVAVTCLVTYLVLPPERFDSIGRDAVASAGYVINWRLSAQSVDYLAQGQAPSPFQHFWSLAVEEQFYLVWPLLLLVAFVAFRGRARRLAVAVGAGLVLVASFAYSAGYTTSHPSQAYFVTTTRMWELAVGGVVALTPQLWTRLPRVAAAMLGWGGLACVGYAMFRYTTSMDFPGYVAALPVLGAAAVILAGPRAGRFGPVAVLGRAPMVFLGNISYSLYLWHWPIIVFVTAQFADGLPLWAGLLAGAGSVLPAWLSYRFVETPGLRLRAFASTGAGLRLGLLATLSSVLAGALLLLSIPQSDSAGLTVDTAGRAQDVQGHTVEAGAEVLGLHPRNNPAGLPKDTFASITPSPLVAYTQDVPLDGRCSRPIPSPTDIPCFFGDPHARITIDLVGDSHAMMWEPALNAAALANHWRIISHTKGGCAFNSASIEVRGHPYPQCVAWNAQVRKAVVADHPDLVITTEEGGKYHALQGSRVLSGAENATTIIKGYRHAWQTATRAGIPVIELAETPVSHIDTPSCVTAHLHQLSACAHPRSQVVDANSLAEQAARGTPGVRYVDLNDIICPTAQCAAVIGGVLVYRDGSHVGATYMLTAARYFAYRIAPLVPRR